MGGEEAGFIDRIREGGGYMSWQRVHVVHKPGLNLVYLKKCKCIADTAAAAVEWRGETGQEEPSKAERGGYPSPSSGGKTKQRSKISQAAAAARRSGWAGPAADLADAALVGVRSGERFETAARRRRSPREGTGATVPLPKKRHGGSGVVEEAARPPPRLPRRGGTASSLSTVPLILTPPAPPRSALSSIDAAVDGSAFPDNGGGEGSGNRQQRGQSGYGNSGLLGISHKSIRRRGNDCHSARASHRFLRASSFPGKSTVDGIMEI
uniref:Uncharacterized protein n=1 Tax=Oryza barthii TaxID=65489 RepID=A0A0D3FPW8_9ORYZ